MGLAGVGLAGVARETCALTLVNNVCDVYVFSGWAEVSVVSEEILMGFFSNFRRNEAPLIRRSFPKRYADHCYTPAAQVD